jgi:hypothetical protein
MNAQTAPCERMRVNAACKKIIRSVRDDPGSKLTAREAEFGVNPAVPLRFRNDREVIVFRRRWSHASLMPMM